MPAPQGHQKVIQYGINWTYEFTPGLDIFTTKLEGLTRSSLCKGVVIKHQIDLWHFLQRKKKEQPLHMEHREEFSSPPRSFLYYGNIIPCPILILRFPARNFFMRGGGEESWLQGQRVTCTISVLFLFLSIIPFDLKKMNGIGDFIGGRSIEHFAQLYLWAN